MVEKYELDKDSFKYSYEEAEKSLTECEKMINKEIQSISKFTYANFDELLKMIFENCGDISELDSYIEFLRQSIINSQNNKERMIYQKTLTRKDIIEENVFNIYGVYGAIAIGSSIFTTDPLSFTKTFLILSLIGITTFKINLDYFTSDYRKKQIDNYLVALNQSIENDKFNILILKKLKGMCVNELQYEVSKLYEIINSVNNNDMASKKLEALINGIDIELFVDSKKIKSKIKKK